MARRGDMTSLAERLSIRDRAADGATDASIAHALQRSIWTVRKWRRRGQIGTMTALATRLGRPAAGPLSTWPAALKAHILDLRHTYPGWGALTILVELQRDPTWNQQRLPSRARIGALLQATGLTRRPQRHTTLPEPDHPPHPTAHGLWELDAKGPAAVAGVGMVSVINSIDVSSRLKMGFCPAGLEHVHWRSYGADTLHYTQRYQQKYGTRCRYDETHAPVFLSANDSDTKHTDDFASRRS